MAAAGYVVHPARTGSNGVYSWERSSYFTWDPSNGPSDPAAMNTCREKYESPPKTEAEIREIYDRWLLERACLIELGLRPRDPPSFREFLSDWETGPWTPIDGIAYDRITGRVKDRCGLEMTP